MLSGLKTNQFLYPNQCIYATLYFQSAIINFDTSNSVDSCSNKYTCNNSSVRIVNVVVIRIQLTNLSQNLQDIYGNKRNSVINKAKTRK